MPELAISADKVAFIIEKAREFDVKEGDSDPDSGSNPSDDDALDVLEDDGSDPVVHELGSFMIALNEDEQLDLVTLTWLGRGDGTIDDWNDLRARAVEARSEYGSPRRETSLPLRIVQGQSLRLSRKIFPAQPCQSKPPGSTVAVALRPKNTDNVCCGHIRRLERQPVAPFSEHPGSG